MMKARPGTFKHVYFRFLIVCVGLLAAFMNARSGNTVMMYLTSAIAAYFVMELIGAIRLYRFVKKNPDAIRKAED